MGACVLASLGLACASTGRTARVPDPATAPAGGPGAGGGARSGSRPDRGVRGPPEGRARVGGPGRPRGGPARVRSRGRPARFVPGRSARRPARSRGLSPHARDRAGARGRALGGDRGRGGRRARGDRRRGRAAGERRARQPRDDGARRGGGGNRDASTCRSSSTTRWRPASTSTRGACATGSRRRSRAARPTCREFRRVFAEQGLPQDLAYVALVESAFKTSAYSRAKAKGVFQFVSATGRRYGLSGRPVGGRARRSREGDARRGPVPEGPLRALRRLEPGARRLQRGRGQGAARHGALPQDGLLGAAHARARCGPRPRTTCR